MVVYEDRKKSWVTIVVDPKYVLDKNYRFLVDRFMETLGRFQEGLETDKQLEEFKNKWFVDGYYYWDVDREDGIPRKWHYRLVSSVMLDQGIIER